MSSGEVFLSYRRGDSSGTAGRIFDRMEQAFGRGKVFMDVDAIEPGVDFVSEIEARVTRCDALLAVIGPDWLSASDGKRRRLDAALARNTICCASNEVQQDCTQG